MPSEYSPGRRWLVLAFLGVAMFGVLSGRLYQMQAVEGAVWHTRARNGLVRRDPIPAPRGRILDCRGRVLVANRPRYGVSVLTDDVPNLPAAAAALAPVLHLDARKLTEALRKRNEEAPMEPMWLAQSLDRNQLAALAEVAVKVPGVTLDARPRRWYPLGRTASHLLGYTGEISPAELQRMRSKGYVAGDVIGKSGVDAYDDMLLRGQKGARFVACDPAGRSVRVVGLRRPQPGCDLRLTLDAALQQRTEAILLATLDHLAKVNGERSGGAVVVLDVHNGAILAMASLPQYDPAFFANQFNERAYLQLLRDPMTPLLDRAFQAAFSPGSTFKLINASAALQEKLCTPSSVFYCSGSYKGAHCFVRSGHGRLGFYDTIALSCDVTYYRLGDLLHIDRLARYARAFGLGKPTGVDLPGEEAGIVPSPQWKRRYVKDDWYEGDTINTAIGQGFLIVSPLQMACYTAAIANGGRLWRPHLFGSQWTAKGTRVRGAVPHLVRRVPVDGRWLAAVREGMRGAVLHGTATIAQSPIIALAGKTGTVETTKSAFNPHGHNHVWFTCFGPYEKPQIVVTVFLEKAGGYGGQYAAPVARQVAEAWCALR